MVFDLDFDMALEPELHKAKGMRRSLDWAYMPNVYIHGPILTENLSPLDQQL